MATTRLIERLWARLAGSELHTWRVVHGGVVDADADGVLGSRMTEKQAQAYEQRYAIALEKVSAHEVAR